MKDHFYSGPTSSVAHLCLTRGVRSLGSSSVLHSHLGLALLSYPASRPRARTCSHIIIFLSTRDLLFSLYSF
eukprot:scaffold37442_cov278-Skeletonema_dohrnii-CCMP3373.AAC.1